MVDDGAGCRTGPGHALGHPARQVGALHGGRFAASHRDGALEQVEALRLVGEDAGQQREPACVGRRVERVQVAAGSLAHLEAGGQGRVIAGQEVREAHGRVGRAKCLIVLLVAEAIEAQVEPGARTQLEQPQWEPGSLGDQAQRRGERLGAGGRVRLQRMGERVHELRAAGGDQVADVRPGGLGVPVAIGRGVVPSELRSLPREHDPVHPGQKPEGVPLIDPVAFVTAERRPGGPSLGRVVTHALEQDRVEARADPSRHLDVAV